MNKIKLLIIALCLVLPIPAVATGDWFTMAAGSGDSVVTTTDFVTVWRTTSDAETITLPLRSGFTYNATVDWGDGTANSTITAFDDADRIHEYTTAGDYTVSISGVFQAFYFNNAGDKLKLIEVQNLGAVGWTGTGLISAFHGCANLVSFTCGNSNTSAITSFSSTFNSCTNLVTVDASGLDTSAITSFSYTFNSCTNLVTVDTSGWDTSAVTSFYYTFYICTNLNKDISAFNISSLTNATGMMQASAFGSTNYDKMLVAWAGQQPNILNSVAFHAGTAKYTEAAARAVLATTHSWTITDGGSL